MCDVARSRDRASDEHERRRARAGRRARVAHAAARELVDEGAQAEVAVGSGHDGRRMPPALVLLHGFTQTRQSWRRTVQALAGTLSRARAGPPGPRSGARSAPAELRGCTGRTCARSSPTFTSPATRWAAGSRCTPRSRSSPSGSSWWAPARACRTRPSARSASAPTTRSPTASSGSASRRSRAEWGAQPLFEGQPERVTAAAYADRLRNTPHGLAAALRGLGTGVMEPLWDRLPRARRCRSR